MERNTRGAWSASKRLRLGHWLWLMSEDLEWTLAFYIRTNGTNWPSNSQKQGLVCRNLIQTRTNEWNVDVIHKSVPQYEDAIRKLIPSPLPAPDERVWLSNANGEYSIKSGYAIAKLCKGNLGDLSFNWTKCLWQVVHFRRLGTSCGRQKTRPSQLARCWRVEV